MTLHLPTHPVGYADHHVLRDGLIIIGALALALVLLLVVGMALPGTTPSTTERTEMERLIDFRAGERAEFAAPVLTEDQRMIEFRAGERAEWATPVP